MRVAFDCVQLIRTDCSALPVDCLQLLLTTIGAFGFQCGPVPQPLKLTAMIVSASLLFLRMLSPSSDDQRVCQRMQRLGSQH